MYPCGGMCTGMPASSQARGAGASWSWNYYESPYFSAKVFCQSTITGNCQAIFPAPDPFFFLSPSGVWLINSMGREPTDDKPVTFYEWFIVSF